MSAWYAANRAAFLDADQDSIVAKLASAASAQGLHIEPEQHQEWGASVGILQHAIRSDVPSELESLRGSLGEAKQSSYSDVILEYDFRRRGLRIDCVLLAPGIIAVLEFKRSSLAPADADQVTNYCVNLVEFHEESRRLCKEGDAIVVPILIQTEGTYTRQAGAGDAFHAEPWGAVLRDPIRCDREGLGRVLVDVLRIRRGRIRPNRAAWLSSRFSPSSTRPSHSSANMM